MTDPSHPEGAGDPGRDGGGRLPQTWIESRGISPLMFAILSLVVLFISYQMIGGLVSYLMFGIAPRQEDVLGIRLLTGTGQILLLFIPTLLLVRLATFAPLDYLRVRRPRALPILLSFVGIISLQQILQIYLVLQDMIPLPESLARSLESYKQLVEESLKMLVTANSIPELLLVLIVIALIPAVAEEFLFRGLVQRSVERSSTPLHGAIVTGIVFGAYHLIPSSVIPLAVLGIYLGFLTYRANSLWVAVAAHFCNNAIAVTATYLRVDDDAVLTGDPNEMPLALLLGTCWFFGIVFLASTYFFIRVTAAPPEDDAEGEQGEAE